MNLLVLVSLLTIPAAISATDLDHLDPIPGYTIIEPVWEIQLSPGAPPIILNGTVQQVQHKLRQLNINAENVFPRNPSKQAITDDSKHTTRSEPNPNFSINVKREIIDCHRFPVARRWAIEDSIDLLQRQGGNPINQAGPASCMRVSCTYNSAIYWCNDLPTANILESWAILATGAQNIISHCFPSPNLDLTVAGQWFHIDYLDWNVIIRGDVC
ncbi:hypothetical protein QBC35DRAFT_464238 [Podospora australis]|uniref:Peptidase M15A C-terminal domain-containing protein n=1 Tax=Podospora australis TaxID=1536484 RepID=A0AAN7AI72_9PEZI|nr:hypothetical protein QBC35DRAFT_464238 [Podospora australis]